MLRRSCRRKAISNVEEKKQRPESVQSPSHIVPDTARSTNKKLKIEDSLVGPIVVKSTTLHVTRQAAARPTPEECSYVTEVLGKLHPAVLEGMNERRKQMLGSCGRQKSILDGAISTMLSQNTTAANSTRAFSNLKNDFPSWDLVVKLENPGKLEESIRCAGLAQIRAKRIWNICQTLQSEKGSASFEYLRYLSNDAIKEELSRFQGFGKKTISCVLLFTLGREEFPVDTHVWRISKDMKWVPSGASRDDAYDHLNQLIPPHLKLDLHCLLIEHGRQCHRCAARGKPQFPPADGSKLQCPLINVSKATQVVSMKMKAVKTES
jgi:endonuclease-3